MTNENEPSSANDLAPPEFSWAKFFSEIFVPRKGTEMEERLSWGFPDRVPPIESINTEMPRPWLFARCLLFSLLGVAILWYALIKTEQVNLVPAFMMFGCFAVPCSVMLLFFETNIFRDVSFVRVIVAFLVGAVMSLCLTMPLDWLARQLGFPGDPWVAGPVEEPAKLIVALILLRFVKHKTVFSGLLIGSAVGAGFAAFESAGYSLQAAFAGNLIGLVNQQRDVSLFGFTNQSGVVPIINQVANIVVLRGMLSPFCHVVWTALTTAAICRATGGRPLTLAACKDPRFYGIFGLVVCLHMIWNSPLGNSLGWLKFGVLGLIAWTAVAAMLKNGLRQARSMKLALAAGDTSVLGAVDSNLRVSPDQDLWYQRGNEAHGPLKMHQLTEMVDSGVLTRSTLMSDGVDWHPYGWWAGDDITDSRRELSEVWAWGLVWWPIVIVALAWFLGNTWILAAFPLVLVGMALIDRLANRGGRIRKWPTSVAAIIPPLYLALRRRALGDGSLKFALGTVVTGCVVVLCGLSLWMTFFTEEGRVMMLVNDSLESKGITSKCVEVKLLKTVTPNVKLFSVKYSNGTSSNVTWIQQGETSKVEISSP